MAGRSPAAPAAGDLSVSREPDAVLNQIFNYRGILANLPLIVAVFWTRGETPYRAVAWILGILVLLLGTAVRIWGQSHLQRRWKGALPLAGGGPYQMIRNPLYVGNTLLIVGGTICSRLLWLAPIALLWCVLVYSLVVRFEESHLVRMHGKAYREYLAAVPRWLPHTLKSPGFFNEYSGKAVLAELHCLLVLLPFLLKDFLQSTPAGQALWNSLRSRF